MNFENYTRQLKHVCAFPFNISSKIDMIIIKEMKNFEKILVKSVDTKQSLILVPFNNSISTSILQTKWNVLIACHIKSEREREIKLQSNVSARLNKKTNVPVVWYNLPVWCFIFLCLSFVHSSNFILFILYYLHNFELDRRSCPC